MMTQIFFSEEEYILNFDVQTPKALTFFFRSCPAAHSVGVEKSILTCVYMSMNGLSAGTSVNVGQHTLNLAFAISCICERPTGLVSNAISLKDTYIRSK